MIHRRSISVIAIAGFLVVACGQPGSVQAGPDLLFLQSPGGVTVVEAGASSPSFSGATAVPSRDWTTVVRGLVNGPRTRVVATDPSTGRDRWADVVPGRYTAKIVSGDGDLVALGPAREPYYRWGRETTRLLVAGRDLAEPRRFKLAGNYEPEAFSTDGNSLFVIRYLPARAPSSYQVRRLDLTTGNVMPVYTPHAELQGVMGGTARIQAASPDGRRLYTLYTVRGAGDSRYAFVHVLDLDKLWAHCIDLPQEFATSASFATALTVSPDGTRLYVANSAVGALAEIDTEALSVSRTATFGSASAAHTQIAHDGDTLYVTTGPYVTAIDAEDLSERDSWLMPEKVKGIQVTGETGKLYVALRDRVTVLDADTGNRLKTFDPPGVKRIRTIGPVLQMQEDPILQCAC